MHARNGVIGIVLLGGWLVAGADELRPLGSKISENFGERVAEFLSGQVAWTADFMTESSASWREDAHLATKAIEGGIETKLEALACDVNKSEEGDSLLFQVKNGTCGSSDIISVTVVSHVVLTPWGEVHVWDKVRLKTTAHENYVLVPGYGVSDSELLEFYGTGKYSPDIRAARERDFEQAVAALNNEDDVKQLQKELANAYFEAVVNADSYKAFYVDSLAGILSAKPQS